ncbi:MAG: hypothetical protein BGP23_00325 [Lysobacterales bacterium 66-474]|nr:MAG: hypothetical protein ABT18_11470 [Rhodanobacter sp. SCN 66-43]OJY85427.1 MAG: hypothetical protein BGP23_00325 [Xanthomonadales bacterium 66-474]
MPSIVAWAVLATIETLQQVAMTMAGARVGVSGDPAGRGKAPGSAGIVAGILLPGGDAHSAPPAPVRHDAEGNPP